MNTNLKTLGVKIKHNDIIERVYGYDIVQMNFIFSLLSEETQQMWFDDYKKIHHDNDIITIAKSKDYFEEYYKKVILPDISVNVGEYTIFKDTKAETTFELFRVA